MARMRKPRTNRTYGIDDPLIPAIERVASRRSRSTDFHFSQNDLVNEALYKHKEVREELRKQDSTHVTEETTQPNEAGSRGQTGTRKEQGGS